MTTEIISSRVPSSALLSTPTSEAPGAPPETGTEGRPVARCDATAPRVFIDPGEPASDPAFELGAISTATRESGPLATVFPAASLIAAVGDSVDPDLDPLVGPIRVTGIEGADTLTVTAFEDVSPCLSSADTVTTTSPAAALTTGCDATPPKAFTDPGKPASDPVRELCANVTATPESEPLATVLPAVSSIVAVRDSGEFQVTRRKGVPVVATRRLAASDGQVFAACGRCDQARGCFMCRPVLAAEFDHWFSTRRAIGRSIDLAQPRPTARVGWVPSSTSLSATPPNASPGAFRG